MKFASIALAAASAAVVAAQSPGKVSAATDAPTAAPANSTKPSSSKPSAASNSSDASVGSGGASPLDKLTVTPHPSDAYHMPYVRVVHARVQSDKPELVKGRFVSSFGNGDLAKGYLASLDTVNTASVEGALLFVQAEGINQNSRSASDRCVRKNEIKYIVLYEILIAQTNETIAQYSASWAVPEYSRMIPMDSGQCTPLHRTDVFPPECLQYNGDKQQPNIGPSVGAGGKADDVRAPYPNTFWFSFPNTCPLEQWGKKSDSCRATTRKGLCDIGKAPDGVECTFAYDILGWVPIDDVVGITNMTNPSTRKPYANFTEWCEASAKNVEFAGDVRNGKMDQGLPFWEDPLNETRNAQRADAVIQVYQNLLAGSFKSSQVAATDLKNFKDLPDPADLAKKNPPCYKTVPSCNAGFGCKRSFFAQLCVECKAASHDCKTDPSYKFPTLARAKTPLKDADLTSGSKLGGKNGATGGINGANKTTGAESDASARTGLVAAMVLVVAGVVLAV